MRQQGLGLVDLYAVGHREIDVDRDDVASAGCGSEAVGTIDAEGNPQQIRKGLWRSGRSENSRVECQSFRAFIKGIPPSLRGGGSSISLNSCVVANAGVAASAALARIPLLMASRDHRSLRCAQDTKFLRSKCGPLELSSRVDLYLVALKKAGSDDSDAMASESAA
jgi:hypothetical protein